MTSTRKARRFRGLLVERTDAIDVGAEGAMPAIPYSVQLLGMR